VVEKRQHGPAIVGRGTGQSRCADWRKSWPPDSAGLRGPRPIGVLRRHDKQAGRRAGRNGRWNSRRSFEALLLGILEGLTEFIPVSSTGHILLAGHFLGFQLDRARLRGPDPARRDPRHPQRLFRPAVETAGRPAARRRTRRFVLGILIAFLPAAVIGALAHSFIKTVLFETPMLICVMLIVGGVILLVVDRCHAHAALHATSWISRCRSASRSACSSAWR
jgi:hypothetical protein